MYVKKFEAPDMKTLLSLIKNEMGPDAVILSTKRRKKRGGKYGFDNTEVIEVTAAIDGDFIKSDSYSETLAYDKKFQTSTNSNLQSKMTTMKQGRGDERVLLVRRGADDKVDEGVALNANWNNVNFSKMITPLVAEIYGLKDEIKTMKSEKEESSFKREIDEIKMMMNYLVKNSHSGKSNLLKKEYEPYYSLLLASGINESYAANLILTLQEKLAGKKEFKGRPIAEIIPLLLTRIIIGNLGLDGTFNSGDKIGRIISLIGPTGAGKTTTIAKIASDLIFSGFKIGLITLDTYRIAAAEQLKIYGDIIGAPVEIADSRELFLSLLQKMDDKDYILIDTAGRSHMDLAKINESGAILKDKRIENHLVLSCACDERNLGKTIENFSSLIPVHKLIFSKLDETYNHGALYNITMSSRLPVSYVTTGQKVPEDIENASPEMITDLILNPSVKEKLYSYAD